MTASMTYTLEFLEQLSLRKLCLLSVLLGGVAAMALPPLYIFPSLLAFSALFLVLDKAIDSSRPKWSGFWISWSFGFGYFTFSLYWISYALLVDLEKFWWVFPLSIFGLPLILACFTGFTGFLCGLLRWKGVMLALSFSVLWVVNEWLRSFVLTGFPWNLVGYSWGFSNEMIQLASLTGVYGLSFLTLLLATAATCVFYKPYRPLSIAILALAILCYGFGTWRLNAPSEVHKDTWIRLVQPSTPQTVKWNPAERENNFDILLQLSQLPSPHPLKAIIWPETAVPFFLEQEPFRRELIQMVVPKGGYVLTGAPRRTPYGVEPIQIWNSITAIDDQGEAVAHYDKSHLVPFGEYFPMRSWIEPFIEVKKITAGSIDFSPGGGPEYLQLPNLPAFGGLVCYESIFPSEVVCKNERPQWLLNVTNDGWYGVSPGPYQHLEISRMRSVEEGIPMIRSANTGVSAVFDAYGRQVASMSLMTIGVKDFQLPKALPASTFYGKFGNLVILCLLAAAFAALAFTNRRGTYDRFYLHQ